MTELQKGAERSLVSCSLWLHIGFIGASALAAGLIRLSAGNAGALSALALAISGGVLALASWRRGRTVLDSGERAAAGGADAAGTFVSRAISRQTGRSANRLLPPIPLPTNRSLGDDRRYTTSD